MFVICQAHFYYGAFLQRNHRLMEAREQYGICVQNSPNKPMNHYRIANVYYHLKDWERFEYHINRTLQLDPYHHLAKDLYQHYEQYGNDGYYLNEHAHRTVSGETEESRYDDKSNASTGSGDSATNNNYDMAMLHPKFKAWLQSQCLLDQYGYIFVKYGIHSLNDLKTKRNVKFRCRPIDKNVIEHAAELYNTQSDNN